MRDSSHDDFIERWAVFVKDNPGKWKQIHTQFIDSQFIKNREFLKRLTEEKGGKEKIIELYGIKNKKAYSFLI